MTHESSAGAQRAKLPEEIRIVSYPPLLYFWPVIVVSGVCGLLDAVGLHAPVGYGAAFLAAFLLSAAAMGVDIPRNVAVIITLTIAVIGLLLWIFGIYSLPLAWLWEGIVWLMPRFEVHTGLGIAVFGGILYVIMLLCARLDSRWEINPNQFEHIKWGRSDRSITHGAKAVRCDFRDVLELLLGVGGGDLVIYDANGTTELERIGNIPFLMWRKEIILEYLEEVRVRGIRPGLPEGEDG